MSGAAGQQVLRVAAANRPPFMFVDSARIGNAAYYGLMVCFPQKMYKAYCTPILLTVSCAPSFWHYTLNGTLPASTDYQ